MRSIKGRTLSVCRARAAADGMATVSSIQESLPGEFEGTWAVILNFTGKQTSKGSMARVAWQASPATRRRSQKCQDCLQRGQRAGPGADAEFPQLTAREHSKHDRASHASQAAPPCEKRQQHEVHLPAVKLHMAITSIPSPRCSVKPACWPSRQGFTLQDSVCSEECCTGAQPWPALNSPRRSPVLSCIDASPHIYHPLAPSLCMK